MRKVLSFFIKNTVFANIVLLFIIISGIMAVKFMIKETFPDFALDMIAISVLYPGADPEEVEEGISRKIEEVLEGLEGVKQYTTKSSEGIATVQIEVAKGFVLRDVLDKVRSKVDSIYTFPVDAEKPVITEISLANVALLIALSGNMPEKRLKEWGKEVKEELQQIPAISKVDVFGTRKYEIGIEISEAKLRKYNISFNQVVSAIRSSNLNMAGGTIRTKGEEIRIRTMGRKYTGNELSEIVVLTGSNGEIITLDRVAEINDGFSEDPISASFNGNSSIFINVLKTSKEDSLAISEAVISYVRSMKDRLPPGAHLDIIFDTTDFLKARIDLLIKNGSIGLCLIFLLLWLFLDHNLSFWVGMGVPLSIGGGLILLWMTGQSINMISLFGLIMVLGIIVDDAIVVGEAVFVHRQNGDLPLDAAVNGIMEVGMPVVSAVVTTIVSFCPLLFVDGVMGSFIAILPAVVIACLIFSLIECIILLPAHLSHLPDPDTGNTDDLKQNIWSRLKQINKKADKLLQRFIQNRYKPFLQKALHYRYIFLCTGITLLMFTMGLIKGEFVKFETFPEIDGFIITANVRFPNGTPVEVTKKAVKKMEASLIRLNDKLKIKSGKSIVINRMTIVGQSLGEMPESGAHLGGIYAILVPSQQRDIHSKKIEIMWENEIDSILGAESLTLEQMAAGPPGAPVEIWIQGHNMDDILTASDDLIGHLGGFNGVYQIHSDFSPGKNELRLKLKPEAYLLGITVDDFARQINTGFYGNEAVRLQRGKDDIKIKVRYTSYERSQLSKFKQFRVRTPQGHEVPLFSVADIKFSSGYATITRTNGMRRVAVFADIDTNKANAGEIIAELSSGYFKKLKKQYPELHVSIQGESKKNKESFSSLLIGFPLAIVMIYMIIATMFASYTQPLIIMFVVPFGIIGSIFGHLVMGYNLCLLSVFGMVALSGVVVNDSIVLIERINKNIFLGMKFHEAIINGSMRRFRAIILTTLSTAGGLLPLILETDMQARFLIPMALSLAAGVSFATVLTLIFLPSLFVILNDLKRILFRIKKGVWPKAEEVELYLNKNTSLQSKEQG